MNKDMRREFANSEELVAYLQVQFPTATARDNHVSNTVGGRKAAQELLAQVNPSQYASSRNFLTGAVTRLSPYIRYGVLNLAEIRDYLRGSAKGDRISAQIQQKAEASKLINELGWRDYWQRLYAQLGNDIWRDLQPYKTGYTAKNYAEVLPDDIAHGTTSLVCIDSFSRQLRETGYLHNHARLWLAAYIVHWRSIRWQAGAVWFLQHLLDGDPASNNLSWQWVTSTFSQKPYFFNRENLERHTEGAYCRQCPLYGSCDFEGSYEQLQNQLFPKAEFYQPTPQEHRKDRQRSKS